MPYEFTIKEPIVGIAAEHMRGPGDLPVISREFTSSEDGDIFILRLEKVPTFFLNVAPADLGVRPSVIDHMLVIIQRSGHTTVYVNELEIRFRFQPKRRIAAGQVVRDDDVARVLSVSFEGISIPPDAGVMVLLSKDWRKGLYFDYAPLDPRSLKPRDYNLEERLGQYYSYLANQHLFKITEEAWAALFDQGWFPFVTLSKETTIQTISHANSNWNVDDLLDRIAEEAIAHLEVFEDRRGHRVFIDHMDVLDKAIERYRDGDFISANHILYPRIEGIMRSIQTVAGGASFKPPALAEAVTQDEARDRPASFLLPERFRQFLEEVYFKNFDPHNPADLSRHTIAHGVAPQGLLDKKAATVGLLILQQLAFFAE